MLLQAVPFSNNKDEPVELLSSSDEEDGKGSAPIAAKTAVFYRRTTRQNAYRSTAQLLAV